MGKRTAEDDAFVERFATELNAVYNKAKKKGVTNQAFADSIGVERITLDRYLAGTNMPEFRSVVLAYRNHGIRVPYAKENISVVLKERRAARTGKEELKTDQMELPFSFRAEAVDLKIRPVSADQVEIEFKVRRG